MVKIRGEALLLNHKPYNIDGFLMPEPSGVALYEVFRIIDCIPLFIEDHINRFIRSIDLAGLPVLISGEKILADTRKLIGLNPYDRANIRLTYSINPDGKPLFAAYFIEHQYPDAEQVRLGVPTVTLPALRQNPNAKIINKLLMDQADLIKDEQGIYEVLLIDADQCVTEGSRSNVFFIKESAVYTPPVSDVLPGITRMHVIGCLKRLKFKLLEQKIPLASALKMDAAFITGTSRKVLPVNRIDNTGFPVKNKMLYAIMREFEKEVSDYLQRHS